MRPVETRKPYTIGVGVGVPRHPPNLPNPHEGMFDVDCSSIAAFSSTFSSTGGMGRECVNGRNLIPANMAVGRKNVSENTEQHSTNAILSSRGSTKTRLHNNSNPSTNGSTGGFAGCLRVSRAPSRPTADQSHGVHSDTQFTENRKRPLYHTTTTSADELSQSEADVTKAQKMSYGLVSRETLVRLYIVSMFTGIALLGAVGWADSQEQVFVSFALFSGVFVPVVVLHGTIVVHKVWALVPMIIYVVYSPVSVSLSIIHKTHVFISTSLILVCVFFLMAGVSHGLGRMASWVFLALFVWLCFSMDVDSPNRGDMVALVIIPGVQILCVCITGVISVMGLPMGCVDRNWTGTVNNPDTC